MRKDTATKLDVSIEPDADDRDILRQVVSYYHETLKESPEALRYLESRGLTHPEMLDRFQLRFSHGTLGYRLPEKNRKSGAEMRGRLQKLGILRDSGHEHFNGRASEESDLPSNRAVNYTVTDRGLPAGATGLAGTSAYVEEAGYTAAEWDAGSGVVQPSPGVRDIGQ